MNNLGVMNGTAWRLYFGGQRVMRATNTSWSMEHKLRDITSRENFNWTTQIEGIRGWSVDVEGFTIYNTNDGTSIPYGTVNDIIDTYIMTQQPVFLLLAPDGQGNPSTGSMQMYFGSGYIKSVSIDAPNEDNVTYNISIEGKGSLSEYSYYPFYPAQSVHP